jgi:hypothetical protein
MFRDSTTIYRLTPKEVPVDAFWSITVCDAKGMLTFPVMVGGKLASSAVTFLVAKMHGSDFERNLSARFQLAYMVRTPVSA